MRLIDWNVTARTTEPHVRVHLAERVLVTWIVLDTTPSMAFGTAERRKADVALGATLAVGHAATIRGNRVGLVGFGGDGVRVVPPRQGRAGLVGLLLALRDGHEPSEALAERLGVRPLAEALRQLGGVARQRALVVVVSDFAGSGNGACSSSRSRGGTRWWPSRCATRASRRSSPPARSSWSTPRPGASCGWTL